MTHSYDVVITRQYSWAYATIEAQTPEDALRKIRRKIAKDHHDEAFDYEHFDAIGDIESISIERCDGSLAEYIAPAHLLSLHAESLLSAAEEVIGAWEKGDLAAAVSNLGSAVAAAKGRAP
jgi:hypothetical protein